MYSRDKIIASIIFGLGVILLIFSFHQSFFIEVIEYSKYQESYIPEPSVKLIELNFSLVIALSLTAFILMAIMLWNLRIAIFILFLLAPITRQVEYLNIFTGKVLPFIVVISFLLNHKFSWPRVFFPKHIQVYIALLLSGLFLSTIINGVPFLPFLRQIAFFIVMYVIYISSLENNLIYVPCAVLISCSIIIIDLFLNSLFLDNFTDFFNQTGSFFNNQTAIGTLLFCSLPYVYLIKSKYSKNVFNNFLWFFVDFIFVISAILTGSRGSLVGIIIMIFLMRLKKISFVKFLTFIILCFLSVTILSQIPFVSIIFRLDNPLSHRDLLFAIGYDAAINNWLFGIGPQAFSEVARNFGESNGILDLVRGGVFGASTHNVYLDAILDAGLLGLIGLLILYVGIFRYKSSNPAVDKIIKSFTFAYMVISFFGSKVILGGAITEGLLLWTVLISFYHIDSIQRERILQ